MPFKLTKQELTLKQNIVDKLAENFEKIKVSVEEFNKGLNDLKEKLSVSIETYNGSLAEAREFISDVVSQQEEHFSNRSERWQESEKGEEVSAWLDDWREADLDEFEADLEADLPDEILINIESPADFIEQLPDEPS